MYCQKCKDLMESQVPLKDEDGYDYPYSMQLCIFCRPSDFMTEDELEYFLDEIRDEK